MGQAIPKIKELEEYCFDNHNSFNEQVIYKFPNGLGASVIFGENTYGIEMMLLSNGKIDTIENQIKNIDEGLLYDVVGYLNLEKMKELLNAIKGIEV